VPSDDEADSPRFAVPHRFRVNYYTNEKWVWVPFVVLWEKSNLVEYLGVHCSRGGFQWPFSSLKAIANFSVLKAGKFATMHVGGAPGQRGLDSKTLFTLSF
jgi:hypothetical protein